MPAIDDKVIRERAFHIWEREGRPHGRDMDHWLQARWELLGEKAPAGGTAKAAARRSGAAKTKVAAGAIAGAKRTGRRGKTLQ
jgi:hypothetical protein